MAKRSVDIQKFISSLGLDERGSFSLSLDGGEVDFCERLTSLMAGGAVLFELVSSHKNKLGPVWLASAFAGSGVAGNFFSSRDFDLAVCGFGPDIANRLTDPDDPRFIYTVCKTFEDEVSVSKDNRKLGPDWRKFQLGHFLHEVVMFASGKRFFIFWQAGLLTEHRDRDIDGVVKSICQIIGWQVSPDLGGDRYLSSSRSMGSSIYMPDYSNFDKRIKDFISSEFIDKVVLSRLEIYGSFPLREIFVDCLPRIFNNEGSFLAFQINPCGDIFVTVSPEKLISNQDGFIETEAVAGTRKVTGDVAVDVELGEELRYSEKDISEHRFVIDFLHRSFIASGLSVKELSYYYSKMGLLKLKNVQHLFTPMSATIPASQSFTAAKNLINNLHPTPAVAGTPVDTAQKYIKDREEFVRGLFTGAIGIHSSLLTDIAVGIRSALLLENETFLFSGAGVVKNSDPATEWEELNEKTQVWKSFLAPEY